MLGIFTFNISSFGADSSEHALIKLAKDALRKEFTNTGTDPEVSIGDINNDGVIDFSALVEDPTGNDLKIVVFLGGKNKTFKLYKSSGDTFKHERVYQLVQIKKGSIFLHRDGSGGCCSHWAEDFQFKLQNNEIALIGFEVSNFVAGDIPDDSGHSINFITSTMVNWKQKGKQRTEKKIKISPYELIKLENFTYDEFTSTAPKGVY